MAYESDARPRLDAAQLRRFDELVARLEHPIAVERDRDRR